MRRWKGLVRAGLVAAMAYRGEFLVWVLSTNMPLVMLLLWQRVAAEHPVGRFDVRAFRAYFLVTLVVRLLTGSWVVWQLTWDIREGSLGPRLLRPIHPFVSYAIENLAVVPLRLVVALPLGVAAWWLVGPGGFTHDPVQAVLGVLSVAGAWVVIYAAQLVVAAVALYWDSALSLYDLWMALGFVFSGYALPLELLPPWLRSLGAWTPFRSTLALPVEALLGLHPVAETARALGVQALWAAGLWGLAELLWRRGLRRFAAYGG